MTDKIKKPQKDSTATRVFTPKEDDPFVKIIKLLKILIPIITTLIIFLLVLIIILFIVKINNIEKNYSLEKQRWYEEHYFIKNEIEKNIEISLEEQKKRFQLRAIGYMKESGTTLTDEELVKFTDLVFELSNHPSRKWNPYLAIAVANVESSFNKNATGTSDDRGLYQFLPSTATMVSKYVGIEYYNGIEYSVLDATQLWFGYMDILLHQFNNSFEHALLSYNMGAGRLIALSNIQKNNNLDILDLETGNINIARKTVYGDKKSYDQKVFSELDKIKTNF